MPNDYDFKIDDEKINSNYLKAKVFYENKIPVHLLKTDREWYNGIILELTHDFFIIDERKKGRRMVFFIELWEIDEMNLDNEKKEEMI